MKAVILAGGFGTRFSEETEGIPKPMIQIDGRPILWHIMKTYAHYGITEFIVCLGYKGYSIKEYFANYFLHHSNVTFDFQKEGEVTYHDNTAEPWKVTLIDTGVHTMTGGRIKRIQSYVGNEPFLLTYGDGVTDLNIQELIDYHNSHEKMVTVTAVQTLGRFGVLKCNGENHVTGFYEKPAQDSSWINAGYFVVNPEFFNYLDGDETVLERTPLERCAQDNQLAAYKHSGFWQAMDTLRDKKQLVELCRTGKAPWKVWEKGAAVPSTS